MNTDHLSEHNLKIDLGSAPLGELRNEISRLTDVVNINIREGNSAIANIAVNNLNVVKERTQQVEASPPVSNSRLAKLILDGLYTNELRHKQWYLEKLATELEIDLMLYNNKDDKWETGMAP